MKINWKVRFKNPYFWIGLFAVIMSSLGIEPDKFTSWGMVIDEIKHIIGNPFLLISLILAVFGVVTDPTTTGICDSRRALNYTKPRNDSSNYNDSDFGQ